MLEYSGLGTVDEMVVVPSSVQKRPPSLGGMWHSSLITLGGADYTLGLSPGVAHGGRGGQEGGSAISSLGVGHWDLPPDWSISDAQCISDGR